MNVNIKTSLFYLLMALFLAGSFQTAYAKIDMADGLGHSNCEMMVEMADEHGHHGHGDDSSNQKHDHETECADGQCAHSYCASPIFSALTQISPLYVSKQPEGRIVLSSQLILDNYPVSLYRPPRV